MKMIGSYGFKPELHWACEICIVRPICKDNGCFMTDLFNSICITCEKNKICKEKCKSVELAELFDDVSSNCRERYKKIMIDSFLKQSLFNKLTKR